MPTNPPMINVDDIKLNAHSSGEQFGAALGSITNLLGMRKLGCSLVELEPGMRAWPFHLHYGQEELFVVLAGEGTLRYDDNESPIRTGDVIFAPTGERTAHQIINTSERQLRYLALSSMEDPEICYYPDSDKYGSYSGDSSAPGRLKFMAAQSSGIDYWQDE